MEVSGHDTCNPKPAEIIKAGMKHPPRPHVAISWVLQLTVAGILLQTLFFKFTGAEESVYIFSSVGRFLHLARVEPWGRIASGMVELVASLLRIVPATASIGAVLTMGVMAGAIATHLIILGIDVKGDGGLLFGLALTAFVGSAIVLVLRRSQIPVLGRFFQLA
ncbi:MAG: DoxX family protein [Acidobacteriota bacterium]